jgi:hypothetical protein
MRMRLAVSMMRPAILSRRRRIVANSGESLVERACGMGRQIVHDDTDPLRGGKVNVSKVAHAVGEVDCSAAAGDFDLAPGPMHFEEDEQVGRSIALELAVVALDLPTASPDRLPNLADQLGRALIETNDRMLGIGGLGVEIEHILQSNDPTLPHRCARAVLCITAKIVPRRPQGVVCQCAGRPARSRGCESPAMKE